MTCGSRVGSFEQRADIIRLSFTRITLASVLRIVGIGTRVEAGKPVKRLPSDPGETRWGIYRHVIGVY